jgi:hypothetical protein
VDASLPPQPSPCSCTPAIGVRRHADAAGRGRVDTVSVGIIAGTADASAIRERVPQGTEVWMRFDLA